VVYGRESGRVNLWVIAEFSFNLGAVLKEDYGERVDLEKIFEVVTN